MIKILYAGAVSACFELDNDLPFYAPEAFRVTLNGKPLPRHTTNVFSVFGLKPSTAYILEAEGANIHEKVVFTTAGERCAVDVTAFGARGDGVTEDTAAIQAAVQYLPEGGRLFFPAGTYLTLPIVLKSHITLEFARGAVLLGSNDRERYPVIPGAVRDLDGGEDVCFGTFEGSAAPMYQSLLSAGYAEDITIIGPGTLDGNAQNSDWQEALSENTTAPPRLMFFNRCKNVTIHGSHSCNTAFWQMQPFFSESINFFDISVSVPKLRISAGVPGPEADPGAGGDVSYIGCRFTVGDIGTAVRKEGIELEQLFSSSADRYTIRNCLLSGGHGSITPDGYGSSVTPGSEIRADWKNLKASQCCFEGIERSAGLRNRRG